MNIGTSPNRCVALFGYCCKTGLGIANYDFFSHLPFARWIVVPHQRLGVDTGRLDSKCHLLPERMNYDYLEQQLVGLEVVFCIERGYYPGLWLLAKARGVRVVLMPNAEWFNPRDPEMKLVDTFIAPTLACAEMLAAEGFSSRTEYIPHVVDTERFAYSERKRASSFLHCRGWGGHQERKGTDIVLSVATRCPHIPFVVRCQSVPNGTWPTNVRVLSATETPELQYENCDICIQPSRWEGVGLQILEAMSCGIPTIVPDAAPMNEYPTRRSLCVPAHPALVMLGKKAWVKWEMDEECLVTAIQEMCDQPISDLSAEARRAMETRSWTSLRARYMHVLGMV